MPLKVKVTVVIQVRSSQAVEIVTHVLGQNGQVKDKAGRQVEFTRTWSATSLRQASDQMVHSMNAILTQDANLAHDAFKFIKVDAEEVDA